MSLGEGGWRSTLALVNGARDPSGFTTVAERLGPFTFSVTTTEQSLDFQSHAQGRLPVTATLFILEQSA